MLHKDEAGMTIKSRDVLKPLSGLLAYHFLSIPFSLSLSPYPFLPIPFSLSFPSYGFFFSLLLDACSQQVLPYTFLLMHAFQRVAFNVWLSLAVSRSADGVKHCDLKHFYKFNFSATQLFCGYNTLRAISNVKRRLKIRESNASNQFIRPVMT